MNSWQVGDKGYCPLSSNANGYVEFTVTKIKENTVEIKYSLGGETINKEVSSVGIYKSHQEMTAKEENDWKILGKKFKDLND